jgi:tRNASer (uridine44-2'-O)-methyltransferase
MLEHFVRSCGNGLLTHILIAEGYDGQGMDLRARASWSHYPQSTQDHLHVHAFDPTHTLYSPSSFLKEGTFIIGNHADELTPWIPVLSTIYSASGYISIPCCSWAFEAKYDRSSTANFVTPSTEFVEQLNLGGDGVYVSAYSMYRIWLASLSLHCGWEIECETLRIPSTRNWAIIGTFYGLSRVVLLNLGFAGRKRTSTSSGDDLEAETNARKIVQHVLDRGLFKTRKPEGKFGDH